MSWDSYVNTLLQYNGASCACVAGRDGNIWASSPDFKPSPQEIQKIISMATSKEGDEKDAITVQGKKCITLRCGENCLSALGNEYAIDARILKTMVIITGSSKPRDNPGVNRLLATAGDTVASHLASSGY